MFHPLQAISPIDGRYQEKTNNLRHYASEAALIKYRLTIEIEWLIFLSEQKNIEEITELSIEKKALLRKIVHEFSLNDAEAVKNIENSIHHDVKAIEYFLKKTLSEKKDHELIPHLEFIHFACTSEDINNLAYALMLKEIRENVIIPTLLQLLEQLIKQAQCYADIPMLARTHGQPATPTTLGKEFANIAARLKRQIHLLLEVKIVAKFNGATGNFNAHLCAYPNLDWPDIAKNFIEQFGLEYNAYTTQIEPHDYIAEYAHTLARINTICIDFSRDIWGYIALDYFKQHKKAGQVGSSTMPHKINPIDFENAEGNLGIANALFYFFSEKLPISRWQRDLSDSTVLRNLGVAIAHSLLAYTAVLSGLDKLIVNAEKIADELNQQSEVITEAIQTVLRKYGVQNAYEQLKTLSQGKNIGLQDLRNFIQNVKLPETAKQELLSLTPSTYVGLASILAKKIKT